ncbi:alkaline phosphatase family protein [[Eubacterium] cellulosolvens]
MIPKLIYVLIDGMGDRPTDELGKQTPLEAATTPNMDSLAKNGKVGLMYTIRRGVAPESDVAVISLLGYDPFKYSTGRGVFEALGADMLVSDGDLALRCNFATLGRGEEILDRRAGRDLAPEEAKELSEAINKKVSLEAYPVNFEFKNTIGHRGVLVIRSLKKPLTSRITNTDPAYSRMEMLGVAKTGAEKIIKKSVPMDDTEEAKTSARLVNEFVEKSHAVLEKHEVNGKRAAEGKLKADIILTRDAGHLLPKFFNIDKRYGARFVSLTDMPVERGISKAAGMHTTRLPPPSHDLKKDCRLRADKLLSILHSYDCFYIHIKGPDEPGHDGDCKLKEKLISIIDKHFIERLLLRIDQRGFIICITADHSTPCQLKAHSDDPVPLLIYDSRVKGDNVSGFSEKECKKGSLGILENGSELIPKLIDQMKK